MEAATVVRWRVIAGALRVSRCGFPLASRAVCAAGLFAAIGWPYIGYRVAAGTTEPCPLSTGVVAAR